MMQYFIILFNLLTISIPSSGNQTYIFNSNGVEIAFEIDKSDLEMNQVITIINHSNDDIFIPISSAPINRYFYQSKNQIHSYHSIIHSVIGPMSLEGSVDLKKLSKNESFSYKRKLYLSDEEVNEYWFAFDFIDYEAMENIKLVNDKYRITVSDYMKNNHSFFSKIIVEE